MANGNQQAVEAMRRRRALLQNAERWLSLLLQTHKPSYSLARAGCVDSLVIVAVTVEISAITIGDLAYRVMPYTPALNEERLRLLRDAIDLFYMALALDPSFVRSLKPGNSSIKAASDPLALKALKRGGKFQLQITISETKLEDTKLLKDRLCRYFVETLDQEASTNPEFLAVRSNLIDELDKTKPTWRSQLEAYPVVLRYSIVTRETLQKQPYEMEDYVRFLIDFITCAATLPPSPLNHDHHRLPLTTDRVTFSLSQCLITHRSVQLVKRLLRVRKGFAVCERVRVEPPMLHCSLDETTELLDVLASGRPILGLVVDTGSCNATAIDTDGMDRSELCDLILRGVANCDQVKRVNLGGMTQFCKSPETRRGIYRAMLERLFARPIPLDIAVEIASFSPSDTQLLQEEHVNWRKNHPEGRLRVKKLFLQIRQLDNSFVPALLSVLDDVESLEVRNSSSPCRFLPIETIVTILKFPSLRDLDIAELQVASMDIFLEPWAAKLVALKLSDFQLADEDSFVRFARAIGDPTTQVARTLHELHVLESGRRRPVYRMSGMTGEELAKALKTNHLLGTLHAAVTSNAWDAWDDGLMQEYLSKESGRVVRAIASERNSTAEKARRAAFLSVLQNERVPFEALALMDALVVQLICTFHEPAVSRRVHISISYGGDAGSDNSEGEESNESDDGMEQDDEDGESDVDNSNEDESNESDEGTEQGDEDDEIDVENSDEDDNSDSDAGTEQDLNDGDDIGGDIDSW